MTSNCIPWHIPQRNENLCSQKKLYMNIYSTFICNSPKLETTLISLIGEWFNKLWCIHTMEYDSAIKRHKLLIHITTLENLQIINAEWEKPILKCFTYCMTHICTFFFLIYLFIFGCVGPSFLRKGFLQLRQAGATLHRGARASHYRGPSHCRAQAPDAQAQ